MPATTPGMTVSYRDGSEGFDYTLFDSIADSPSYGPKFGLLVVDSHFEPVRFDTTFANFQDGWVGYTVYGRTKSGNAAFGLTPTNEWTARLGFDVDAGEYMTTPLETKTWDSMPPVPAFHDSYNYYPGFYYPGGSFVYLHDSDSSVVLPAKGDYSTRITDVDGDPLEALYGVPIGPGGLGTGNPGDDHVQFGVHAEVLSAEEDDSSATVMIWNNLYEVETAIDMGTSSLMHGDVAEAEYQITENIGGKLENPLVIVEVPAHTNYIWGSAYGGLTPIIEDGLQSPQDAAAFVASVGFEEIAGRARSAAPEIDPIAENVHYLVWTGDDIGTSMDSPVFGFAYKANAISGGVASSTVTFFKNWDEEFQTVEAPSVLISPIWQAFLPIVQN
jgi:hypothetical protein